MRNIDKNDNMYCSNLTKYINKEVFVLMFLIILGLLISIFYIDFITFKGELKGEYILYVKIDGNNGSIIKINNKYSKDKLYIKNSENLGYGTYLVRFDIKNIIIKNNYTTLIGKIKGYKPSKLNAIRKYVLNIIDDIFIIEDNLYAFSKAAILGEKSEIKKDIRDKYNYTGLAHLIVISGTHISLIIFGVIYFLDKININYKIKYILAFIFLTIYCFLVGMSFSVMRAYIMGSIMILARLLFENEESKKSLFIALIITIILNPYSIFDVSMQLTYTCAIAIIFVYPVIEKYIEKKYLYKIKDKVLKNIIKLLILTLTIQIVDTPLFLYHFNKLPLFSFLLNIVGIPIGTVLIQVLFFIVLLNVGYIKIFNNVLFVIAKVIYNSFEGFVYLGSKIPLLQLSLNIEINIVFIILYYLILYIILKILSRKL